MRTNFKSSYLLLFAITGILAVTVSSCKKDDPVKVFPPGYYIASAVGRNPEFSTLNAAVAKAGLTDTLKIAGLLTLFAPDNAAFTASGITSIDGLQPAALKKILMYHLLGGQIKAGEIKLGTTPITTTNTPQDTIYVTKTANGVFINGNAKVKIADTLTDNGVIHTIDRVLIPPAGNIVATAIAASVGSSDNELDSLVAAIVQVNKDSAYKKFIDSFLTTSRLTVFAPTNKAFRDLLVTLNVPRLSSIADSTLYKVLAYHLVAGRAFSPELTNGSLAMFPANAATTINLTNGTGGGPTIKGSAAGALPANIIAVNIMATNGVVHVIDRVLLQ